MTDQELIAWAEYEEESNRAESVRRGDTANCIAELAQRLRHLTGEVETPPPPSGVGRLTWPGQGPAVTRELEAGRWRISVDVSVGPVRGKERDELACKVVGARDSQIYPRVNSQGKLKWQRGTIDPWTHWDPGTKDGETFDVIAGGISASWIVDLAGTGTLWVGPDATDRPADQVLELSGWTIIAHAERL